MRTKEPPARGTTQMKSDLLANGGEAESSDELRLSALWMNQLWFLDL